MTADSGDTPPLWERYVRERGRVHLTGLQALVRLLFEQVRRDRRAGRRVGAVVSGYPGSPLAALDQLLQRVDPLLREHHVQFLPALNEELAASAIGGSQLFDLFPHTRYQGVIGMWFGKAPGLDRSLDALRHSNFMGTARYGGALAVVGDDPFCKSSSLPSHSEHAFAHAFVPLVYPGDAAEVLELGLHGYALSRYAGLWCGIKLVADVADGGAVFDLPPPGEPELPKFDVRGAPFQKRFDARLLPPVVNRIEEEILYERLEAARRYAFANQLDRIHHASAGDRVGIVASGRLYRELESALERLGLDRARLGQRGIRLYQLRMLYPLEPRRLREFADGLDEIIVVDERRGFAEDQIKASLFNAVDRPVVLGQFDERGQPWLARHKEIRAETLALDLASHLAKRLDDPELERRAEPLERARERHPPSLLLRKPHFCSGCPHSESTRAESSAVVGGGIGCHTMALMMDRGVRFVGAMGSEGSHWTGLAWFVDTPHLFQNLGDGTYFHSGRLAVRSCVVAGVPMTFKLLYNGSIAMTGGQQAVGAKPLAEIARDLVADGVSRVVIATTDPRVRRLARRERAVECIAHDGWEAALERLSHEQSVTVAIYDELCANEKQRLERRGILPKARERIVIQEDVCEGCGDCGRKSSCASLRPVSTRLGRKTRIHQSSCSDDTSCLRGDCPSFLSVATPPVRAPALERWLPTSLPRPQPVHWERERFELFMVGVGSTGVVTVDALIVRAAELDGLFALHLDQTGLAQRGGKVVSHCVLGRKPLDGSPRVGWGAADTLLAFDPLGASDAQGLRALDASRTRAVLHADLVPTVDMISRPELDVPSLDELSAAVREHTRSLDTVPAESLAQTALDEPRVANVLLLGFALQRGLIPVSAASLEQAIRENGVAVDKNLGALRLGRAVACDARLCGRILADTRPPAVGEDGSPDEAAGELGADWDELDAALERADASWPHHPQRRLLAGFATDLIDYQSRAWARRYVQALLPLAQATAESGEAALELVGTAARELYRLMAYKDEYEVARLLLRGPFRRWLERRSDGPLELRYHLHPPLLRALGLKRKLALGPWVDPLLQRLVALRRLRGTLLDPFGYTHVRRTERWLVGWYECVLERVAETLSPHTLEIARQLVAAPGGVRGFEEVKLERLPQVQGEVERLLASLPRAPESPDDASA